MKDNTKHSSNYFKTNASISFSEACLCVEEEKKTDVEAYYVQAMLFKMIEDDEYVPLRHVSVLMEGFKLGSILCKVMVGILHQQGKVIEKHPIKAKRYIFESLNRLKELAYKNNMYASGLLGFLYIHGLCVEKDMKTAVDYYQQAIAFDFVDSYHQLGYLYLSPSQFQDIFKGQAYIKKALDANYAPTWFSKGIEAIKHKKIDEAILYLEKASQLGSLQAMFSLATLYETRKESSKAFAWFIHAANKNHVKAKYMVGLAYQIGKGVLKDETKAHTYLVEAAKLGDVLALFHMANMEIKKPNPNMEEVYDFLNQASVKHHPLANHQLAMMYEEGKYMMKDVKTALALYERSLIMQFPPSLHQAAKILLEGLHVPKNTSKATQYLELAAQKKYKPSIQLLETLKHQGSIKTYTA